MARVYASNRNSRSIIFWIYGSTTPSRGSTKTESYEQAQANFEVLTADIIRQFGSVEDLGETTVKQCLFSHQPRHSLHQGQRISHIWRHTLLKVAKAADAFVMSILSRVFAYRRWGIRTITGTAWRIRESIAADGGKKAQGDFKPQRFQNSTGTMQGEALKTAPKGYAADHLAIDLPGLPGSSPFISWMMPMC